MAFNVRRTDLSSTGEKPWHEPSRKKFSSSSFVRSLMSLMSLMRDEYLHWTSSVVELEVTFPSLLSATHRYSPLSALFTLFIVNSLLFAPKLILGRLLFNKDPSLVHVIDGTGSPLALQDKVTLSSSVTGPTT